MEKIGLPELASWLASQGCKVGAVAKASVQMSASDLKKLDWHTDAHKTAPKFTTVNGISLRTSQQIWDAIALTAENATISVFEFKNDKNEPVVYARITAAE